MGVDPDGKFFLHTLMTAIGEGLETAFFHGGLDPTSSGHDEMRGVIMILQVSVQQRTMLGVSITECFKPMPTRAREKELGNSFQDLHWSNH
jgi:hypothetical protein